MKTTIKFNSLEIENDVLERKLKQLIQEFPIAYIFYHSASEKEPARIVIVTKESPDVEIIESRKWIRNGLEKESISFHITCQVKMDYEYGIGNPFIACYCNESAIIYQSPQTKECNSADWASFKKKFKRYSTTYFHDIEILLTEVNRFNQLDSLTGVFISNMSVFELTVRYLEILYLGRHFASCNLHFRIKQLAQYIPCLEGIFVKKSKNEYYLISELEKGEETAEDGDEIRLNDKLIVSFIEAETKLYNLVIARFSELKSLIKSGIQNHSAIEPKIIQRDDELDQIIKQILKIQVVEEIYLFHQTKNCQANTYYLLLIGEGLGTKILNRVQQSVNAKFEGKFSVVLLGHSRIWIQTNLFCHQSFFKKIMHPDNRCFQSHQNHPSIHWETSDASIYPDIEYCYRSATKMAVQYFVLRNNSVHDNTEGIDDLFCKSVLRILRTYVFAKLSYLPHYLSAFNLWKLSVYADPKLELIEFLFEKCCGNEFFKEVDRQMQFYHGMSRLTQEEMLVMDEILELLLQELNTAYTNIKDINY